ALPLVSSSCLSLFFSFLFSTDPAPTYLYTLSLHDALPISSEEFKTLINNPRLASTSINDLDQPIKGSQGNGIWQYTRSRTKTPRSEEHTSELQSRFDLVCRLLLEKKKKTDK